MNIIVCEREKNGRCDRMSKKKKIKRLTKENAELRERLKYIEGYYAATNCVIKAYDDINSNNTEYETAMRSILNANKRSENND